VRLISLTSVTSLIAECQGGNGYPNLTQLGKIENEIILKSNM